MAKESKSSGVDPRIDQVIEALTPRARKQSQSVEQIGQSLMEKFRTGGFDTNVGGLRASDLARRDRERGSVGTIDEAAAREALSSLFSGLQRQGQPTPQVPQGPTGPASGSAQVSPQLNLGAMTTPQNQMPIANFLAPQVNTPLPPLPIPGQGLPGFQFPNALA